MVAKHGSFSPGGVSRKKTLNRKDYNSLWLLILRVVVVVVVASSPHKGLVSRGALGRVSFGPVSCFGYSGNSSIS